MMHYSEKNGLEKNKKILLAFSGGLDTSAIIPWLKEHYKAEVVAYCSDLGNTPVEEDLRRKALELGASDFIFEDLKEYFVSRFVFPAVRAGATYQDDYLLGTALGRPLIAERVAYFAKKLQVSAVAHGCTGKGNDQLRFEQSWAYLIPEMEVIAPWRIWSFTGRADLVSYLAAQSLQAGQGHAIEKQISEDVNLFHRSCEGGVLEDPSLEFNPDEIYKWVAPLRGAHSDHVRVEISFEDGVPVAVNQNRLAPVALLSFLNQLAGAAGVGVQDVVEERINGIKSRGIYETPGGTILHLACRALKHLCWDRRLMDTARSLAVEYGECIYDGLWHTDLRRSLESFFLTAAETLTGSVLLKMERGVVRIVSRQSPFSLYDSGTVTFEDDKNGVHRLADGYCKIAAIKHRHMGRRDQNRDLE